MPDVDATNDRSIAVWNETDSDRRRALIAQTWTEDAGSLDPIMSGEGHAGIDALVAGLHGRFSGYGFRRTSGVDAHHDRVRFGWEFGPEGGPAFAGGLDIGEVVDGRLRSITGVLDFAPTPAGG